jgi:2-polyprenyl-3-methyl-5-hydroxy-6-metoxy-1,4-benzoquinol methylase
VKCHFCKLNFVYSFDENRLKELYKQDYYNSSADPRIDSWIKNNTNVWNGIVNNLCKHKDNAKSLLDVGAGTGGFIFEYMKRLPKTKVYCIESSEEARESIKRKLPSIIFPVNDVSKIELIDNSFDIIVCLQTMEHLYDPLKTAKVIHSKLSDNGIFLITVPNAYSYLKLQHGYSEAYCYNNPTHLQFFSMSTLPMLLKKAGFSRIKRIINFGGSNIKPMHKKIIQYILRTCCLSTELRYMAFK